MQLGGVIGKECFDGLATNKVWQKYFFVNSMLVICCDWVGTSGVQLLIYMGMYPVVTK